MIYPVVAGKALSQHTSELEVILALGKGPNRSVCLGSWNMVGFCRLAVKVIEVQAEGPSKAPQLRQLLVLRYRPNMSPKVEVVANGLP